MLKFASFAAIDGRAADIMATTSNVVLPSKTRRHAAMRGAGSGVSSRNVSRRCGIRSTSLTDYGGGGGSGFGGGSRLLHSSRAQAAAGGRGAAGTGGELHAMMSTSGPAALDAVVGSDVLRSAACNGASSSQEQPTRYMPM